MNGRNVKAGGIMRPEERCQCKPWKGIFSPGPKTRKRVQKNGGNDSGSSLVRLSEAIEQEFGMLDSDLTTKVRGPKLKSQKPRDKSESNQYNLKGGIYSADDVGEIGLPHSSRHTGSSILYRCEPPTSVPEKRQRPRWEYRASKVDKQPNPRPTSPEQERTPFAQDSCPRNLAEEPAGAGESYKNTLLPIRGEGNLKPSKLKQMRRYGVRMHKYLEDGMKLVEQELHELAVLHSDPQHNHPREPLTPQPKDLTSEHCTAKDCAKETLNGSGLEPALPPYSGIAGEGGIPAGHLLVHPSSLKTEHCFEDHEVLLAQRKVRELRLEPVCTTSSEFASGPQLDSSQGLSVTRSRDCASEEKEVLDEQLAEKQLEELLIPSSQGLNKEPCRTQTEQPDISIAQQTILVEGRGALCKVQNSEGPSISSDGARQECHVGSKGYIADPSMFREALENCKATLHKFYTVLIATYKRHEAEAVAVGSRELPDWPILPRSKMLRAILSKYSKSGVRVATPDDKLFYIEGLLNATVFLDFDQEGFGLDGKDAIFSSPASRQISFIEDFNAPNLPDSFGEFFRRKLELVAKETDFPTKSWPNVLTTAFFFALTSVWRAHRLAFAFEPPATMFQLNNCLQYDDTYMEPHTPTMQKPPSSWMAEFMVTPGFHVQDRLVVRSRVYCIGVQD